MDKLSWFSTSSLSNGVRCIAVKWIWSVYPYHGILFVKIRVEKKL